MVQLGIAAQNIILFLLLLFNVNNVFPFPPILCTYIYIPPSSALECWLVFRFGLHLFGSCPKLNGGIIMQCSSMHTFIHINIIKDVYDRFQEPCISIYTNLIIIQWSSSDYYESASEELFFLFILFEFLSTIKWKKKIKQSEQKMKSVSFDVFLLSQFFIQFICIVNGRGKKNTQVFFVRLIFLFF